MFVPSKSPLLVALLGISLFHGFIGTARADAPPTARTFYVPPFCAQATAQICGSNYILPTSTIGGFQSVNLPQAYVVNTANFQCVAGNGVPFYQLLNGDVTNCARKTCKQDIIKLCGVDMPVTQESKIGDQAFITLDDKLLDRDRVAVPVKLSLRCDMKDNATYYRLEDDNPVVSCNAFLCQPAKLSACDADVDVAAPATLGTVLHLTSSNDQAVTVSCVGEFNGAPRFKVTDTACR